MRIFIVLFCFLFSLLSFAQEEFFEVAFEVYSEEKPLDSYFVTISDEDENQIKAAVQRKNNPFKVLLKRGKNYNVSIGSNCHINHRLKIDENFTNRFHLINVSLYKTHCSDLIKREYQFKKNEYKLSVEQVSFLKELATLLDSSENIYVKIHSHRDFFEDVNMDRKRGEMFRKQLISLGVDPNKIRVTHEGISNPLLDMNEINKFSGEEKDAAHQVNQRISLSFHSEE